MEGSIDKTQDILERGSITGKHAKWKTNQTFQTSWKIKIFQKKVWFADKRYTPQENASPCMTIISDDDQFEEKKSVHQQAKGPT